ncbi:response regulator [Alienimonas sp. DA493]|uniref:response regulator n=1 Tax=Alienimonas sp. DA493 TaxID=3373605 RepID=UPI0037544C4A
MSAPTPPPRQAGAVRLDELPEPGRVRLDDLPGSSPAGAEPAGRDMLIEPPFRVLVAEDNDALREVVLAVLERFAGVLELLEACHGGEAVRIIRGERVDVAVLDFRMPQNTGLEAYAELRAINPAAPGILISAETDEAMRRDAAALTVHRVLAKPVARRDLLAALDSALRTAYRAALPAAA